MRYASLHFWIYAFLRQCIFTSMHFWNNALCVNVFCVDAFLHQCIFVSTHFAQMHVCINAFWHQCIFTPTHFCVNVFQRQRILRQCILASTHFLCIFVRHLCQAFTQILDLCIDQCLQKKPALQFLVAFHDTSGELWTEEIISLFCFNNGKNHLNTLCYNTGAALRLRPNS